MDIYRTSGIVSGLLVLTGIVAFLVSASGSVTALIPAFLGGLLGVLTAIARAKPSLSKAVMHGVVLIALLGALGSLGRVVPALMGGDIALPIAFGAQVVTSVLCVWLVVASVQHFRAQRRG